MKTDVEKVPILAVAKPKPGRFKTKQELADHKYRDFLPKLEAALKDHPAFQKPD
jgi:hypothetical protein